MVYTELMTDDKKPRPKFSAPTPPQKVLKNGDDDAVVTNGDEELLQDAPEIPDTPLENAPTPPAKFITRKGPEDRDSAFAQVIDDEDEDLVETSIDTEPEEKEVPVKEPAIKKATPAERVITTPAIKEPPRTIKQTKATLLPPESIDSHQEESTSGGSLLKTGLLILFFLFGTTGWLLYASTLYPDLIPAGINLPQPAAQPTPEPTQVPEPTPAITAPAIQRSEISLEILNGAGIAGAAGRTADTLRDLGYTIADTGNADRSNYQETQIFIHPDLSDEAIELLLADLEAEYGSASVSGDLDDDTTFDVRITLGQNWFEAE
jgi:hypothetical protein